MSFSVVTEFQRVLQKEFEKNKELTSIISVVSQNLIKSDNYPYIYHFVKSAELVSANSDIYNLEGEVNIYFRESYITKYQKIVSIVENIFNNILFDIHKFKYISGRLQKIDVARSKDSLTILVKLNYSSVIRNKINE